ncbi:MAG: hypothetical protein JWR38_5313 [Mucilaginibacter sp.]|nr:hypothetical protein [Mucilaginibacter sp.]
MRTMVAGTFMGDFTIYRTQNAYGISFSNFYTALTSGFKEPIIIGVLVLGIFYIRSIKDGVDYFYTNFIGLVFPAPYLCTRIQGKCLDRQHFPARCNSTGTPRNHCPGRSPNISYSKNESKSQPGDDRLFIVGYSIEEGS